MGEISTTEALNQVPRFLDAIGRGGEQIAFTAYGGNGGNWHFVRRKDGSAGTVDSNAASLTRLKLHGERAKDAAGHQLGFYCARPLPGSVGGSRNDQILDVPCLKVEFDTCSIKDQLAIYREYENCYGVKLTLVSTGSKSIHGYLRLETPIELSKYRFVCETFHQQLEEIAARFEIIALTDKNVARPAQAMRLPGAVHSKTGKVAHVIQFGDTTTLEQIEIDDELVNQVRQENARKNALAATCSDDQVLGYLGDEGHAILRSAVSAWPVRVVGQGTYGEVLPLVAAMTRAVGSERAAQILFDAGHNDADGKNSLEGLRRWCRSFDEAPGRSDESKAFILRRAEQRYGWKIPGINPSSLRLRVTARANNEKELGDQAAQGGGLCNCPTGMGKTKKIAVELISEHCLEAVLRHGNKTKLYASICTPRRTINRQLQADTNGINASIDENISKKGRLPNLIITCPQNLGNPRKAPAANTVWGAQWIQKCSGERVNLGWGANALAYFAVDEFRQILEMLALGKTGRGMLFETSAERYRCFKAFLTTIHRAVHCYAMDAQMGAVEQRLWQALRAGRPDADRVIGVTVPQPKNRTFRWTNDQKTWKSHLARVVRDPDRTLPVLAIVAACGDIASRGGKLSAHGLSGLLRDLDPSLKIVVITRDTKDDADALAVLAADLSGVDVVIGSPALQSGFSFVGKFHPTVFVAGGATMPPNVAGGQAGRRERTATECIAYLPRYELNTSLPFAWAGRDEHETLLRAEHKKRQEPIDELILQLQLDLAERQITELALFTETTLAYADLDGWATEPLPEIAPLRQQKSTFPPRKIEKKCLAWQELGIIHQAFLSCLYGTNTLENLADIEDRFVKAGFGVDLVAANAPELAELLLRSGFVSLCDGVPRSKIDEKLVSCGKKLLTPKAEKILTKSSLLSWRKTRAKDPANNALKTVGALAKQLGGYGLLCGKGRNSYSLHLPTPMG